MTAEIAWSGVITELAAEVLQIPGWFVTGMWGSSARDLWATAVDAGQANSRIYHWNGALWSLAFSAPGVLLELPGSIWGSGRTNVWAVGYASNLSAGYAYRFDGSTWSLVGTTSSSLYFAVGGTSPTDVWICGSNLAGTTGQVFHYDGTTFTTKLSSAGFLPNAVSATSASFAIVVGADAGNADGVWSTWNGATWSTPSVVAGVPLYSVTAVAPSLVYATCEAASSSPKLGVYQWNGYAWQQVAAAGTAMDQVFAAEQGYWAVGGTGSSQGVVYRFADGAWWLATSLTFGTMFCGWASGNDVWIGGVDSTQTVGIVWKLDVGRSGSVPATVLSPSL